MVIFSGTDWSAVFCTGRNLSKMTATGLPLEGLHGPGVKFVFIELRL